MKEIIMVLDDDPIYSKKFCNQAIKLFGKKYLFLSFSNYKAMKEYANENEVESLIISDSYVDNIDDIKANSFYILNEKNKNNIREGKKSFVYKLQNIKEILKIVDDDISKKHEKSIIKSDGRSKLVLFYTPIYIKNKLEIMRKISKCLLKKKKVLILNFDEFENYKGNVGLSNIIFNYKENNISLENLRKEITIDKEQEFIRSVTYPEDFNVVNNIDLANIVNEIRNIGYDFIFINADQNYQKCQYILNDADSLILMKDKENERVDVFKSYIKNENQIELKKITEFDVSKLDKSYITAFTKQCFGSD